MKQLIAIIVLSGIIALPASGGERHPHVVLVSAAKQPLPEFTRKELRLLYLGYSLVKNNQHIEPLINNTQKQIYVGFLQKIMFMSQKNYERQMMARIFRQGGERPGKFSTRNELIASLKLNTNRITFITEKYASQIKDIQVVQKLW